MILQTDTSSVDTSKVGEYDASVVVTDEYGNSAEKAITVVLDTTAPTISGVEDATVETEPTAEKEESDNKTYYYEVPVI